MNKYHVEQTEDLRLIARVVQRASNDMDPTGVALVVKVKCPFAVPSYSHSHTHGLPEGDLAVAVMAPCPEGWGKEYLLKEW